MSMGLVTESLDARVKSRVVKAWSDAFDPSTVVIQHLMFLLKTMTDSLGVQSALLRRSISVPRALISTSGLVSPTATQKASLKRNLVNW